MLKRAFLRICLGAAATCAAVRAGWAQDWPAKPIRILVGFAPGGLTDLVARAMQPRLQALFGQPVVIEDRPGAGGTLAEGILARAAPDGYTLLLGADSVPASPHLLSNLPYDTFRDLLPVSLLVRVPLVLLASDTVPVRTLDDFIARAKLAGAEMSYASPGVGTSNHLYFEVLKDLAGFDMQHVAYKGGSPALNDLVAGHVQAMLVSATLAVPQVVAGKARALAVTGDRRVAAMPDVPTFAEAGIAGFGPQQWTGLFVPAGTPRIVVARITGEFARALQSPDVLARLDDLHAEPVMSSQAEFSALLRRESDALGQLIARRGIKVQ